MPSDEEQPSPPPRRPSSAPLYTTAKDTDGLLSPLLMDEGGRTAFNAPKPESQKQITPVVTPPARSPRTERVGSIEIYPQRPVHVLASPPRGGGTFITVGPRDAQRETVFSPPPGRPYAVPQHQGLGFWGPAQHTWPPPMQRPILYQHPRAPQPWAVGYVPVTRSVPGGPPAWAYQPIYPAGGYGYPSRPQQMYWNTTLNVWMPWP